MKQLSLNVSAREDSGRTASTRLRNAGQIPAVLYGPNGVRHLAINGAEFRKLWTQVAGRTALIELVSQGGEPALSIIQQTQRAPRSDAFLHIAFKEILRGRDMYASISVYPKGDAYGVRNEGATLEVHLHEVEVRCRPRHLPELIEIDVTELRSGQSLKVKDLPALEGVTYETAADIVVVTCAAKVEEVEEAPEEGAAEAAAPAAAAAAAAPAAATKTAAPAKK